jgi:NADPH:quinone reductase-like Zn-dependent oxidoreductase
VESVGDGVESVKPGERVLAGTRFNGQAELVTVRENMVYELSERLSFEEGAAFPVNYATAQAGLVVMGGLKRGERVLIHAAAGRVGISATQIAKRVGAEVFGTASASKHDEIREQGSRPRDRLPQAGLRRGGTPVGDRLTRSTRRSFEVLFRSRGRPGWEQV